MRALFPIAAVLCLALFSSPGFAQLSSAPDQCPARARDTDSPAAVRHARPPEIQTRIRDIRFEGATRLPLTEQNEIVSALMDPDKDTDSTNSVEEMKERVMDAWQDRGFYEVKVDAETRELSSDDQTKEVAVTFHINEGDQYRLGAISFVHETQFTAAQLRLLFPPADGEIFDRWKISEGLSALRRVYGEAGFINFTSVPETEVDHQRQLLFINIDVDEGKQFHISGIEVQGPRQEAMRQLLRQYNVKPGEVYNGLQLNEFARAANLVLEEAIARVIDERTGTVCLIVEKRSPE